jgi:type IV pilus assembly protein PilM
VGDESIWKKEISFGRKSKDKPEQSTESAAAAGAESETAPKESIWKKEISFGRKRRDAAPVVTPEAAAQAAGADEPEVVAEAPNDVPEEALEAASAEPLWERAVSFTPAREEVLPEPELAAEVPHEPVTEEPVVEEPVVEEPVVEEPVVEEPVVEEPVVEEPVVEEPVAEEPVAEEPVAEEPVAVEPAAVEPLVAKPVAEKPVAAEPVAAQPVAAEPVTDEPVTDEPVVLESWSAKPAESSARAENAPVADGEATAPEPIEPESGANANHEQDVSDEPVVEAWSAKPSTPPVHVGAPVPQPEPAAAEVVHPPVPAAELPPLADEKVPFWKKEISFGGKKREKAPKPEKPKAEKAPKAGRGAKAPKEPKKRKPSERKVRGPKIKSAGGGKGAKRIVGLKIGASQLAAARVANNGNAELLQVARERLEPGIVVGGELRDPEALASALKDFFEKHDLPKRGVRLGIANNRIGVRTFEIAGIADPKQLGNAIRFRAQEALPIPLDEAVLDYQVLGEGVDESGQPTRRILLVVAYRELIDRYVDACKKAGIGLVGIDLEAFAILRALQAPQEGAGSDPSAALVAVAIGHERSTFAVSDGRVCEFTRVLEWGGSALNVALARVLNAAPSEVEGVKHELTLTDSTVPEGLSAEQATKCVEALRKAIQTFARELVSSLQYYQNQPGSLGIGEIVLTGGTAHLPGLAGELERLIGVRVRVGDPLARMKVSKRVGEPEQVGSLAVAIGLGIED